MIQAPAPRENPDLFGHEAAETLLAEALRSGRLHHAWLITGPDGVGKATLAYRFARRLLAGGAVGASLALPPTDRVFRRVAAGTHADVLTIEREWDDKRKRTKTAISADDARKIPGFLHLTPAEGGWRVVIVDGAEDLNHHSANALLKVLEEPPPRAILLLVCAAPGRLLPTLRSRCRTLRLAQAGDAAVAEVLSRWAPALSAEARARLVALAEGAPGRALMLADEDGIATSGLIDQVLDRLPNLPPMMAYEIADQLARGEDRFAVFMDLLRGRIARAVRQVLSGRASEDERRLVAQRPLAAWADVWHALMHLQDETERLNLDKRQAVISGLAELSGQ